MPSSKQLRKILPPLYALIFLSGCGAYDELKRLVNTSKTIDMYNESVDYFNAGKYSQALPLLQKAVVYDPSNEKVQKVLGISLVCLGRPEEGLPHLQEAARLQPKDYEVRKEIAMAYERMGKFSDAHKLLLSYSIDNKDKTPETLAHLKMLAEQARFYNRVIKLAGSNSKTDYFIFATSEDEGICRWKDRSTPLRVFIERPHNVRGHRVECENLVIKAYQSWENAANGKIHFQRVADPRHADIKVHFVDNPAELDSAIKAGETMTYPNREGLQSAKIKILTVDRRTGDVESDVDIEWTALHEFGHALGLSGHSPNSNDVMFYCSHQMELAPRLSARDQNTIRMLYSTKSSFVPPKGSRYEKFYKNGENEHIAMYNKAVNAFNSQQYSRSIKLANEYLQVVPTDDAAKQLIEMAYTQKGLRLEEHGDLTGAVENLKMALSVEYTKGTHKIRVRTQGEYDRLAKKLAAGQLESGQSSVPTESVSEPNASQGLK